MLFSIKMFIYISLILFFLPSFALYVPFIKLNTSIFLFFIYAGVSIFLLTDFKAFASKIYTIIKSTPLKIFILFILLTCINTILLSFFGITTLKQSLTSILTRYVLFIFPFLFFYIYIINKKISVQNFISLFLFLLWLNTIIGIIDFVAKTYHITIINSIIDFFNNSRFLAQKFMYSYASSPTETFDKTQRISGLHSEPGALGQFLFLFLPFVYTFASTKVKLFKNKFLNKAFKKTIIPLTWLNLLLTKSPISIIFSIIITVIFYRKFIINSIKKFFILYLFVSYLLINIFNFVNLSNTFLQRIINSLYYMKNFDEFIYIEPSLSTRIVSYINELCLFIKYPITGVGIGNIKNLIYEQYLKSPVPLTEEIIYRNKLAMANGTVVGCNHGFIYTLLAENGIFITIIFLYFFYKLFIEILKAKKNCSKYYFLVFKALQYTMITLFIEFIYDLNLLSLPLLFVIATANVMLYYNRKSHCYIIRRDN